MMNYIEQVHGVVRQIPKGKVATYGQIAKILGIRDVRKIGWALHQNKDPKCPCHRVVNKEGGVAKGYVFGGEEGQKKKLVFEGVVFLENGNVNLEKCLWRFSPPPRKPEEFDASDE